MKPESKLLETSFEKMKKHYEVLEGKMGIEKLPEDCLIQIFKNLPIADRTRIERVNKKFQEEAKRSWSNIKELNIDPKFLGLKPFGREHQYPLEYPEIDKFSLEGILKRCGRYLKKIDLSRIYSCALSVVAEYCVSIESIKCCLASQKGLIQLKDNCKKICELIVDNEVKDEDAIGDLFSVNRNLRVLDIQNYAVSGKCLLKLPLEEMLVLKLPGCETSILSNAIKKTNQLSEFCAFIYSSSIITDLASSCSNLTVIDLIKDYDSDIGNVDFQFSQVFKKNKNLKSIKLDRFEFNGECLLSLNKNSIEQVFLTEINNIEGDYLINSLPHCVKLDTLYFLNFKQDVLDKVLESISLCSNLKTLTLDFLRNFSHDNLIKSLSSSKNIESLTFNYVKEESIKRGLFSFISSSLLNLKYLSFHSSGIFDNDLEPLHNLLNLEEIDISYNGSITGSVLVKFPGLKKLHCFSCNNLEDDNLINFMKCAT